MYDRIFMQKGKKSFMKVYEKFFELNKFIIKFFLKVILIFKLNKNI